jgi:hypothetical protein
MGREYQYLLSVVLPAPIRMSVPALKVVTRIDNQNKGDVGPPRTVIAGFI